MTIFGSDDVSKDDLKWIIEKTAKVSKSNKAEKVNNELKELYELFLPIVENETSSQMGFNADTSNGTDSCYSMWPSSYASEFNELVSAMRETGAVLKAVVGSADEKEQNLDTRSRHDPGTDPADSGQEQHARRGHMDVFQVDIQDSLRRTDRYEHMEYRDGRL